MHNASRRSSYLQHPDAWEIEEAGGDVTQQIIRPTGLLDPIIEIKPATNQIDDCLEEIRQETELGRRVLVTTLPRNSLKT